MRWLISEKGVDTFLFGDKSDFNYFCLNIVNELQNKFPYVKRISVRTSYPNLGQAYLGYILRDFEDTYVPKGVENAGVASYVERNQAMINASDYCIFYYNLDYLPAKRQYSKRSVGEYQPKSGTALAFQYATKKKRGGKDLTIINVYERGEENSGNTVPLQ